MSKISKEDGFWVKNLTNRKVVISDLCWAIQPYSTVNLLDPRHSRLTVARIEKSLKEGSLLRREKAGILKIIESAPKAMPVIKSEETITTTTNKVINVNKVSFPFKNKSLVQLEEKKFEELQQLEEPVQAPTEAAADLAFATEQAEIDLDEHQPKINIRNKNKSKKNKG